MNLDKIYNFIDETREYLYQTRERANLAARDRRMAALLDIDEPTTADVLRADFGTENIEGLDIVAFPAYQTSFYSMSDYEGSASEEAKAELIRTSAGFEIDGEIHLRESTIEFMRYYGQGYNNASNTIGHENIHVLQRLNQAPIINDQYSNAQVSMLHYGPANRGLAGRLMDKFNRAVVDTSVYKAHEMRVSDYLAEEIEIQARMHEIMVNGHAAWGRLPTNKTEFYAALKNIGVELPSPLLTELRSTDEGRQALRDFRCSKVLRENMQQEVKELNFVHQYASNNTTQQFMWETAYPAIYGQLLEYYGDSLGRERLGLGPNQQPAVELMKGFNIEDEAEFRAHIDTRAETLRPELAQELLRKLIFESTHTNDPILKERINYTFNALIVQPDVRNMLSADTYEIRESRIPSAQPLPLLQDAIYSGNLDAIDMCLEAGCNPHLQVVFVDDVNFGPTPEPRTILEQIQTSLYYANERLEEQNSRGLCSSIFCRLSGKHEPHLEDFIERLTSAQDHLHMRMTEMGMDTPDARTTTTAHM